jgi:hypothetical protein
VAAGGSALVTLRDCAASASMRWRDGDGAGVGAAGGGLNCANFRHFPGQFVQLIYQLSIFRQGECHFRIWFAQQTFEPVQVGGGRRGRPRGRLREEALRP